MGIQDFKEWRTDDDVVIQEDPTYEPTHWVPLSPLPAGEGEEIVDDPCPECGKQLQDAPGGGVKCLCGYWFCY